jgi:hypothetical protein
MNQPTAPWRAKKKHYAVALAFCIAVIFAGYFYLYGQDKSKFPDGYDAVQAAPATHKVIFENELVRVLEVTVPPSGQTIPIHHHRWPSFFLDWDTGGGSPHIRYHNGDGTVRDIPATEGSKHAGIWHVGWMKPEPMHSIEVVSNPPDAGSRTGDPPGLRIEIKCHP